ncbi:hypothetical protein KFL_000010870 [Klebsormidium nitens]|uniref:SWIM-type domain-containing protein n=1 Tax=Klebsormidium nitens TaxID=105231 RepID=A0A0U9HPT1_KLENI|nr:hypothetical protein KFL_000010870 [Klebsormidium nitens]|eukprot:GAQ77639.1 hypothetical protein KFL_000010870 [Klebsormidium nitens]
MRKKPRLTAAEQGTHRAITKGQKARVGGVPGAEESDDGGESMRATSIKAQALRYLGLIGEGVCLVILPAGGGSPPLRLYMSAWDHNGLGRAKPLGRPSKECALLEHVWWDTLGRLNCTCQRGRLSDNAPCVHKLALAALSNDWMQEATLPTAQRVKQGARKERIGFKDELGSFFAVEDSPQGPSSKRRMLFRSTAGSWYCEGKNDGCPAVSDCSHVAAAKAAVRAGDVPAASGLLVGSEALARAKLWLEQWGGEVPMIRNVPAVGHREKQTCLSSEQRKLVGLLARQPHEGELCAGPLCFCQRHGALFDEARRDEEAPSLDAASESAPEAKRPRRSKAFWKHSHAAPVAPTMRPAPPVDARGKDAIHGWVLACFECPLASNECAHGEGSRVHCPVMLIGTEAVQISKPKLARLSDAPTFHDPLVTALRGAPIRVSELTHASFVELSERGLLSAPCPLQPPPCGTSWAETWVEASVTASQWSRRVKVRIYTCQCLDIAHTVHFDGEHLGLYTWNVRTLFVQQSLQLLLQSMHHGVSFKAALAMNQAAFQCRPGSEVLSETTWRRASLDYFKLVGLGIRDCCTLCGLHPKVLLCDGIVGVANSDGGKRPGGFGSATLDARRSMTHPSRSKEGELLQTASISGRDYCGAGLEGGGLKRQLVLQPELREALARLSQHRPRDERLGPRLSETGFKSLLDGLTHEETRVVKAFGPAEAEGPLPEDGRRRLLTEQRTMVRDRGMAVCELLAGIQDDFRRRGMNPKLWESWVGEWSELLYCLGAHDADEDLIGTEGLSAVRKLLLGGEASIEDTRRLGRAAPILRRILDAHGGLAFPGFFMPVLKQLYLLCLFAKGATGFAADGNLGWVYAAIRPFDAEAVRLLGEARRRPLTPEEGEALENERAVANELLPGVETLHPSPQQWGSMSDRERALLLERLGRDEEGSLLHPLPVGHAFRAEQDALAHYSFPGWEQKRGLPQYTSFEHFDGRSRSSEEFKCATGMTVGDWDRENASGLVKGGGKAAKKGGTLKRPNRSRGAFVFCCPHRVIYGFHVMLRGESPRDAFAVLYTRIARENLPSVLVYDNACALRNYCMRRAPGHFGNVRFVVDR